MKILKMNIKVEYVKSMNVSNHSYVSKVHHSPCFGIWWIKCVIRILEDSGQMTHFLNFRGSEKERGREKDGVKEWESRSKKKRRKCVESSSNDFRFRFFPTKLFKWPTAPPLTSSLSISISLLLSLPFSSSFWLLFYPLSSFISLFSIPLRLYCWTKFSDKEKEGRKRGRMRLKEEKRKKRRKVVERRRMRTSEERTTGRKGWGWKRKKKDVQKWKRRESDSLITFFGITNSVEQKEKGRREKNKKKEESWTMTWMN